LPSCPKRWRITTRRKRKARSRIASSRSSTVSLLATFKDHFSGHASHYATFRPTYPESLFQFLAKCASGHALAWDCATGNGQAARGLVPHFDRVIATDASAAQIAAAAAEGENGLEFREAAAERSGLEDESVDLITVAQALHWFDIDSFFKESRRVLRGGGILAVWCYARNRVSSDCDAVISRMFAEVENYWPPERAIVENNYRDIEMPFDELSAPSFDMSASWTADDMLGYFRTWSASQRYVRERHADPVAAIETDLRLAWGPRRREVRWPLTLRLGRK
jgi:SAM-dependent methyltransferase